MLGSLPYLSLELLFIFCVFISRASHFYSLSGVKEDIVQKYAPLDPSHDSVKPAKGGFLGYNGRTTISEKSRYAIATGIGGVMVWESGQDCRVSPVKHGDVIHEITCPSSAESLHKAITDVIEAPDSGVELARNLRAIEEL